MRLRILLAYDGSNYSGWQIQCPSKAPRTIQGSLERAFFQLTGQKCRVIGAGRTDAGVHAHGQSAHVDLDDARPWHVENWRHSLNCILPPDIRILEAAPAPLSFHAGKNVAHKTYRYTFWQDDRFYPPLMASHIWPCGPLNASLMRIALPFFTGEHDFATFQNMGTPLRSTIRTILNINLREQDCLEYMPQQLPQLALEITATGFLKQMVRNIAGLLYYIGQKRVDPQDVPRLLETRNRQFLRSPTAPPQGLALVKVTYKTEEENAPASD